MLTKVKDLKQGQTFAYKDNYFVVDEDGSVVQITGKNSGLVCNFGKCIGDKRQINRKRVKVINLEIGEI